jgi:hypothetical protein
MVELPMTRSAFLLSLLPLVPVGAQAAPQCAPRPQVLEILADRFGEGRRAIGLAADGSVMEIFAAPSGTWSLTVTLPDGRTCLLASGSDFEAMDETPPAGTPS